MPKSATLPTRSTPAGEARLLRELARRYLDACADPDMERRREDWRRHNGLERIGRVLVHVRAMAWGEMPDSRLLCSEPALRDVENQLRQGLFRAGLGDDTVLEPWVTVRAALHRPGEGDWGPALRWTANRAEGGAGVCDAPIRRPEDLALIRPAGHEVDEAETARRLARVSEALGGAIPACVDRAPLYRCPTADISGSLAQLRGLEQIMWDMYDRPEWLHRLLALMRDGVLRNHEGAERAGDWRLCNHESQGVNYARDLPDPSADAAPVPRRQLWGRFAAQELTLVGPAQWEEFMLRYQEPIMAAFGLVTYGCCEEMSSRIPLLRRVRNLRRVAVTPVSDAARCAELIGGDYVASYRPSPADMVAYGWNPERVRSILRRDLAAFRANGCLVDITLKDVETVEGDPDRVRRWVAAARAVASEVMG